MKHLILIYIAFAGYLHAQSESDALAFLQQHQPAIHAKILSLKASDAADYESAIAEAAKAAADHARIAATGDQAAATAYLKMYALDFEAVSLSDAILATQDAGEKQALTARLRQRIGESFDQWVIVERARVKRLEAELAKTKAELETAVTQREQVIEKDTQSVIEESRAYQATKKK